ncbi:Auxin-responsive protein IAA30, partial [Mucuna pruriens]
MGKPASSSSSSISSSSNHHHLFISTASSLTQELPTDLSLGLTISATQHVASSISRGQWQPHHPLVNTSQPAEPNDCNDHSSFFVKVYMEGIPIGRKLNILAHGGYYDLVKTLEHMFDTTILWGTEMNGVQPERCHVLTYEDEEGDLVMVGDVPWENKRIISSINVLALLIVQDVLIHSKEVEDHKGRHIRVLNVSSSHRTLSNKNPT